MNTSVHCKQSQLAQDNSDVSSHSLSYRSCLQHHITWCVQPKITQAKSHPIIYRGSDTYLAEANGRWTVGYPDNKGFNLCLFIADASPWGQSPYVWAWRTKHRLHVIHLLTFERQTSVPCVVYPWGMIFPLAICLPKQRLCSVTTLMCTGRCWNTIEGKSGIEKFWHYPKLYLDRWYGTSSIPVYHTILFLVLNRTEWYIFTIK